jgi:hypothetical protein
VEVQNGGMSLWGYGNFSSRHNPIVTATETETKTNVQMVLGTYYKTSKRDILRIALFSCKFMF